MYLFYNIFKKVLDWFQSWLTYLLFIWNYLSNFRYRFKIYLKWFIFLWHIGVFVCTLLHSVLDIHYYMSSMLPIKKKMECTILIASLKSISILFRCITHVNHNCRKFIFICVIVITELNFSVLYGSIKIYNFTYVVIFIVSEIKIIPIITLISNLIVIL